MDTIAVLLQSHPVMQGLDDSQLDLIAGCAHNVVFEADKKIFSHGESASEFYLLRHGSVALEMSVPGRGLLTFLTLAQGEMLGASWLVPPYRWSYDARAITQTRAIAFDAQCLRDKSEADSDLGYALMKRFIPILLERLQAARLQSVDAFGKEASWHNTETVGWKTP